MWDKFLNLLYGLRRDPPPVVAVLRLAGPIAPQAKLRNSLNLEGLSQLIHTAFSVRGVKAVALAINSPGGTPVQSALIMQRIRDMAREKDIPVLAFCEDVAASGGYMLALAGDEIYAHETSLVGSIGVIHASFGFADAISRLGIERRVHTAGEHKSILDPFRPEQEEDVIKLKGLQTEMHDYFKALVLDRRGKRLKGVRNKLFSGDIWLGKEAHKLGLIDGVFEMRSFLRDRFGDRVRIRMINPRRPKWGGLVRDLRLGSSALGSSASNEGNWSEDLLQTIEVRSIWERWGL